MDIEKIEDLCANIKRHEGNIRFYKKSLEIGFLEMEGGRKTLYYKDEKGENNTITEAVRNQIFREENIICLLKDKIINETEEFRNIRGCFAQ